MNNFCLISCAPNSTVLILIIVGWYHAVQMLGGECPSAKLCHIVEPWFLGAGATGASYLEYPNDISLMNI